jgi:two-component system CheB/CheR fusion protein
MLAHELRNPLAAISGALRLLQSAGLSEPGLVRACEAAERQAGHMSRLLDDLLDITRVAQGKITLRQEAVELSSIIESALEATRPQIQAMEHRLSVSYPADLLLNGDPVRLTQVVANLLDNAVKYTPRRGEIHLSAEAQARQVVIRVRDNGSGIVPELQAHVFDLFVQANPSPNRAQGGLGIGLTMVRAIVEMHGGRVEARSAGIGKGSEFVVQLPLRMKKDMAPEANEPEPPPTPRRILVVEDNEDLAEVLSATLTLEGHEVVTALDGRQAIEIALQWRPEVALVDIGMPEISGFDVARALRKEPALADTLLIATTGYGRDEDLRKTREAGFDHHLLKPVDQEVLRRLIAHRPAAMNR